MASGKCSGSTEEGMNSSFLGFRFFMQKRGDLRYILKGKWDKSIVDVGESICKNEMFRNSENLM